MSQRFANNDPVTHFHSEDEYPPLTMFVVKTVPLGQLS